MYSILAIVFTTVRLSKQCYHSSKDLYSPSNGTTTSFLSNIPQSSSPTSTWYHIWYPSPNTVPWYPSPNNVKVCVPYWSHSQYMRAILVSFPVHVCHTGLIPSMHAILVSFPPPEVSQHYLQHQHFGPLLWSSSRYNCCHMYTDSIQ